MTGRNGPVLLVARALASAIFLISGWGKLVTPVATVATFGRLGVPRPEAAYWTAVAVELGGGALLLLGLQTRLVALGLAVFCVATALLAHTGFDQQAQVIQFLKNMAMAGGFLAFTSSGAGPWSLDGLWGRRLGRLPLG